MNNSPYKMVLIKSAYQSEKIDIFTLSVIKTE